MQIDCICVYNLKNQLDLVKLIKYHQGYKIKLTIEDLGVSESWESRWLDYTLISILGLRQEFEGHL